MRQRSGVALAALLMLFPVAAGAGSVVEIETRPGAMVSFAVEAPENPDAAVILFPGGSGKADLRWSSNDKDFLPYNRDRFAEQGFITVVVEPPSDQRDFDGGMSAKFRLTKAHAQDIEAVVGWLRQKSAKPIWLVGISMGSLSVANYGARRSRKIDGIVLLSAVTVAGQGKRSVLDLPLSGISVPVLTVAHEDDRCSFTPPAGARQIVAAATGSSRAEAKVLDGGSDQGPDACKPETPHTFNGIEVETIATIAAFIKSNAPLHGASGRPARRAGPPEKAARFLPEAEIGMRVAGNTLRFTAPTNGKEMLVYFAEDGTTKQKLVDGSSRVLTKRWSIQKGGMLCRTVGREDRQHCTQVAPGDTDDTLQLSNSKAGFSYTARILKGRKLAP